MPPAPPSTHRFSNSLTVEKNVLGGGSIGHILRNRKINPETYAATDVWYHYDQVGSVLFRSNASGSSIGYRLSDAFGNQLASPTTGTALWASDAASAGWCHNTKEHGASTGLVYMYQRWYMPETGTFLSTAPYPPMMEHPYGFAAGNPVGMVDPDGRVEIPGGGHGGASVDRTPTHEGDDCGCPGNMAPVWHCSRSLSALGSSPDTPGSSIGHGYWCCDGANETCYANTVGVKAGSQYPEERMPTGNCSKKCVPRDHKRYYCAESVPDGASTDGAGRIAGKDYHWRNNNCNHTARIVTGSIQSCQ